LYDTIYLVKFGIFDILLNMEKNKTRLCEGTDLRAGCVVTTVNNQVHTIKRITYGNSVAEAENSYYRWEKDFPYEIEHAAMTPSDDDVKHVEFPPILK
jgi:hypothetical protein